MQASATRSTAPVSVRRLSQVNLEAMETWRDGCTLQILCREQDGSEVLIGYEVPDMLSHGRAVESHRKKLAQCSVVC